MRVFISYHRATSDYLAHSLRERLQQSDWSLKVFLDEASIQSGQYFAEVIAKEVELSDVVLALVAPGWPDKKRRHDDYVRLELNLAAKRGKKVIPIRHSNSLPPQARDLPEDLKWFAGLQARTFGSPANIDRDIEALKGELAHLTPQLASLRAEMQAAYERDEDPQALLNAVAAAWDEHGQQPSPALADFCRSAAVALTRRYGDGGPRDLWLARALSTAYQAGASNPFAASLLPFFFRLMKNEEFEAARQVMVEFDKLADYDDPSQFPQRSEMRRTYWEKIAHAYLFEGNFDQAQEVFEKALDISSANQDERGKCKNIGGLALCRHLLGDTEDGLTQTRLAADLARNAGYQDFAEIAVHNLQAMAAGATTIGTGTQQLRTYEVV